MVLEHILLRDGAAFVFADHGNCEQMVNPKTGEPDTEHTCNPVPFIIVSNDPKMEQIKLRDDGVLASIAPTVLSLMNLAPSEEMSEKSLII
jgi:2,3-bisphosphoglycerate-independent phosphoglycerate mutase